MCNVIETLKSRGYRVYKASNDEELGREIIRVLYKGDRAEVELAAGGSVTDKEIGYIARVGETGGYCKIEGESYYVFIR